MEIRGTEDVHELMAIPIASAGVTAALELGLFWSFGDGPRSVRSIAEEFDVPEARCRFWLAMLAALGLFEEVDEGDGYALSEIGRTAVLEGGSRESWKDLAVWSREAAPLTVDLARRMGRRGPVTDDPDAITPYEDKLRADPERARRFTGLLYQLHGWLAESVADTVDLHDARRLVDVGGGSGVVSLALLRRNPELTATVIDLPAVCEAGRAIADRTPEAPRIIYLPLDYRDEELPEADVILTCDARFTRPLLGAIARALPVGGRYLLVDRSFDAGPSQRAALARSLFETSLVDPEHAFPTLEQVLEDIRAVGLEPATPVELERPLWKLVEARKG